MFWTMLNFLLEAPLYSYGSQVAGLFGLVGAANAPGASAIGRLAERMTPRLIVGAVIITTGAAVLVMWAFGHQLSRPVNRRIAVRPRRAGRYVANQTRIYRLSPAYNRLNTIYLVTYFLGGATRSLLGAWSWSR